MSKSKGTTSRRGSLEERFWRYAVRHDGCWEWSGSRSRLGYGRLKVDGKTRFAHRIAYVLLIGPIPEGLELDHLCHNPPCCNPDHLEVVTHRENLVRGHDPRMEAHRAGRCTKGHPAAESCRTPAGKTIYCRPCRRERRALRKVVLS